MKKHNKKVFGLATLVLSSLIITSCVTPTTSTSNTVNPADESFTYNTYMSTKPNNWNTHSWETSDESYIQSFTEMGLYDVILNETKNGYNIVPEMASAMPIEADLSSLSIAEQNAIKEKYGYSGNIGEGLVWDIPLNKSAVWEDGTAINAHTYVESMQRQLDPKMVNFRADSYYASGFVIANAERYFKQGRNVIEAIYDYIDLDTGEFNRTGVASDGKYYLNVDKYTPYVDSVFSNSDTDTTLYTVINNRSGKASDAVELAGERIMDAAGYYLLNYGDHTGEYADKWAEVEKLSDIDEEMYNQDIDISKFDFGATVRVRTTLGDSDPANTEIYTSSKLKTDLVTFVSAFGGGAAAGESWSWKLPLFAGVSNDYEQDFDGVGIVALDDYTFRLYLSQKVSTLDLKFSLSSNWIVKADLYDELKIVQPSGLVVTQYASGNPSNYMSYGPYKLTKFEGGKSFRMERNDKWYGYTDGLHVDQYQMTAISTQIIEDHSVARQMFERGELDDLALTKADMTTYGNSKRRTTTYESYTTKITFNSDFGKLVDRQSGNANKSILSNDKFRQGISLTMDRNNFTSQTTAGSKASTNLLNDLYLTDVEYGEMYRQTDQGRGVYDKLYGELGGDPYADGYTVSALGEDAQGYNFNMGVKYIADGITEEINSGAAGAYKDGDSIDIEFRVYDKTSDTTVDMSNFLSTAFSAALDAAAKKLYADGIISKDTITVSLDTVTDEDYYTTAENGGFDMIFSTWGGATIDPYGLMQVYADATFAVHEYGFAGEQDSTDLAIDADNDPSTPDEVKTFDAWYKELVGESLIEPDRESPTFDQDEWDRIHNRKLSILAGLELGILQRYEAIPLYARGTSSLTSFKVENATSTYVNLVGYGGIRFLEFSYNDAEWNEFITDPKYTADIYK